MTIQVQLPNGQIGTFPDNTPHGLIESVLQKQFGYEPPEPQSFANKLLPNIGAGIATGLTDIVNSPYQLAKMSQNRQQDPYEQRLLSAIGDSNNPIISPESIPHIPEQNYSEMFGIRGPLTKSDKAIQFASGLISPIPGYGSAKLGLKGLRAAYEIPMAAKILNKASRLGAERSVKLNIPEHVFNDVDSLIEQRVLPNDYPTRNLIESAKTGDYNSLFNLQTMLREAGSDLKKSSSAAERRVGKQLDSPRKNPGLRQRLLSSMHESLRPQGHEDISDLLSKGQNRYRQKMNLKENIRKGLKFGGIPATAAGLVKYFYNKSQNPY